MAFDDYKCCCNTHVHSAILAIAIIGWLSGGGALIVIIISLQWIFLPVPLLAGLGNLMLLIGRCTKTVCLYWFFFVTQVLLIAANIWWCVELFTLGNQVMNGKYYTFFGETYKYDKGWGIYFIVLGCIGVLYILLNIYFTYIAFKAYRYMVNVLNTHAHHVDAVMVSTHQTAYPPASVNPGFAPYPQTAPVESFSPSYPQPYPPGQAYPAHTYPNPNLPAGVPGRGFQVPSSVYPDIKSDNANEHM